MRSTRCAIDMFGYCPNPQVVSCSLKKATRESTKARLTPSTNNWPLERETVCSSEDRRWPTETPKLLTLTLLEAKALTWLLTITWARIYHPREKSPGFKCLKISRTSTGCLGRTSWNSTKSQETMILLTKWQKLWEGSNSISNSKVKLFRLEKLTNAWTKIIWKRRKLRKWPRCGSIRCQQISLLLFRTHRVWEEMGVRWGWTKTSVILN